MSKKHVQEINEVHDQYRKYVNYSKDLEDKIN